MKKLALDSFRLRNFKAVKDSGVIKFTPLTVFIGNNGSGKSSVIEGLETYQTIIRDGLDEAMNRWRGFEYIRNRNVRRLLRRINSERSRQINPIEFYLSVNHFKLSMMLNIGEGGNELFIQEETVSNRKDLLLTRKSDGSVIHHHMENSVIPKACADGHSVITANPTIIGKTRWDSAEHADKILLWQFLELNPNSMTSPIPQKRTKGRVKLNKDGSNIAEYLLEIKNMDVSVFNGILETIQYILPYARDLQPTLTSELDRNVYLQITEGNFKVPGWLFSTGTLRFLAIISILRHPEPPPLIFIEEIENGLDPRTIHLIVKEIQNIVESGKSQIVVTTHSPYLLDLLHLSHIVLVERNENNEPVFSRPADQDSLKDWSKKFTPGKLYTMERLSPKRQK
jgi:predicted ATPase